MGRGKSRRKTLPQNHVPSSAALAVPMTEGSTGRVGVQAEPNMDQTEERLFKIASTDIEKIERLAQEFPLLIREARGLLKDLRAEVKKAQQCVPMIIQRRITAEVNKQMEALDEETKLAMNAAVKKVGREFDKLEAIYLGTDAQSRHEGQTPLRDVLERAVDQAERLKAYQKELTDGEN